MGGYEDYQKEMAELEHNFQACKPHKFDEKLKNNHAIVLDWTCNGCSLLQRNYCSSEVEKYRKK